jgi:hypothetical protein
MMTNEQIIALMKNGSNFQTDVVLTIDAMADRIKSLDARIKQLEAREPAKTTLRVVNDAS